MHPKLRKVAATLGLVTFGTVATYFAQFVGSEVGFLYSKFKPSVEAFSDKHFAAWTPSESGLDVSPAISPEAIREARGAQFSSTAISDSVVAQ